MILAYDVLPQTSSTVAVGYDRQENPYTGHVIWTAKND